MITLTKDCIIQRKKRKSWMNTRKNKQDKADSPFRPTLNPTIVQVIINLHTNYDNSGLHKKYLTKSVIIQSMKRTKIRQTHWTNKLEKSGFRFHDTTHCHKPAYQI